MFEYRRSDMSKEEYEDLENIFSDISDESLRVIFFDKNESYDIIGKRIQHIAINNYGNEIVYDSIVEQLSEAVDRLKDTYTVNIRIGINYDRLDYASIDVDENDIPTRLRDAFHPRSPNYKMTNIWIDLYPKSKIKKFQNFS